MPLSIRINSLSKTFKRTKALDEVSAEIQQGDLVALIGPSGSGKSTLLRHIAGLEVSDKNPQCEISVNGQTIQQAGRLSSGIRPKRARIGVIFQQFNLVSRLNVQTNVLIGALGRIPRWRGTLGLFNKQERAAALAALDRVGLKDLAYQRASTLSGGQQQRVAIARSMMQQADVILADEPVASLDPKSAKTVMRSLSDLRKIDGKTVVVTLHQVEYARKYCQRAIALVDGKVAFDGRASELTDTVLGTLYGTSMSEDDSEQALEYAPPPKTNTELATATNYLN